MAKKKTNTQQTQTQAYNNQAQYDWKQTPDSPDIQAYRDYKPEIDPSIAYGAASAHNRLNSSFINPLGGNLTAGMQDAIKRSGNREIDQDTSQAFRLGQYDVNQQRSGQLGGLAALTAPRLTQTGSSGNSSGQGTSNTVQGNNLFGDILQTGQAAAGIALM